MSCEDPQTLQEIIDCAGGGDTGKSAIGYRFINGTDPNDTDEYVLKEKGPEPQFQGSLEGYQQSLRQWRALPNRYFQGIHTGTIRPFTQGDYTSTLGKTFSLDAKGTIQQSRILPAGAAGRDAAAQALDEAQAQRLREQTAIDQQQLELQRQQAAEQKRQNLLQYALSLTTQRMQDRAQTTAQGVQLAGYDPFRLIANLHGTGIGETVQTPYDIFKSNLAQRATQPLPDVNAGSSIEEIQNAVAKLQELDKQANAAVPGAAGLIGGTAPTSGNQYGFAGGGSAMMMGPLQARLVGEAGSQIAPGTEVMITGNGQTTILPLQSGMATGGVTSDYGLPSPFTKPPTDTGPRFATSPINPMFAAETPVTKEGLGSVPNQLQELRNRIGTASGRPLSYSALGYQEPGTPDTGYRGGFGAFAQPITVKKAYDYLVRLGQLSQQEADTITQAIGLLPNPRNARLYLQSLALTPVDKQAILSLYSLAGVDEKTFQELAQSAMLTGPTRQATTIAA